jgi:hypothetical protein
VRTRQEVFDIGVVAHVIVRMNARTDSVTANTGKGMVVFDRSKADDHLKDQTIISRTKPLLRYWHGMLTNSRVILTSTLRSVVQ